MAKRIDIIGMIIVLMGSSLFSASRFFDSETERILDSALYLVNAQMGDLSLPWDAVKDDPFRTNLVKNLFANPLSCFTYARKLTEPYRDSLNDSLYEIFSEIGLGQYSKTGLTQELSRAQLEDFFSRYPDLENLKNDRFKPFLSYLLPIFEMITVVERVRSRIDSTVFTRVIDYADSMLLMSEESENLSVYELKAEEERGHQIAIKYFSDAHEISLIPLYMNGLSLFHHLRLSVTDSSLQTLPFHRDTVYEWSTPYGKIALGGRGNDLYQGDYLVIVDLAGNDSYKVSDLTKAEALQKKVSCIIDLGGDDIYAGGDFSLGGGFFSWAMIIDKSGDDTYLAGDFSLGSGLFGLGIVEDYGGNDLYAGGICTQGSGAFGIGLLFDHQGNDVFKCQAQAQGFGFTRGFGALFDWQGNDSYITSSPFKDFLRYDQHFISFTQGAGLGYRPIASGGLGLLSDFQGNDTYVSDIFGQGTSYWYALGILYDGAGDDHYQAHQYAQGAGIHLAHAVLLDIKGNDKYRSHGVSQGCGHDLAFGALLDRQGDDEYSAFGLSMGGGNANAISLLLDIEGNDAYVAKTPASMMGYSDFRRDYGMLGIFADGGGKDLYSDSTNNNGRGIKSTYGVFADFSFLKPQQTVKDEPDLTPPDSLKTPLASTIDSLFIQACAAPQKFQYNVEPARLAIIERGCTDTAMSFLGSKLNTEFARERHALRNILERLYEKDTSAITSLLVDSLKSDNIRVIAMVADISGRKQVEPCLPGLAGLLASERWNVRQMAARNIGKIGNPRWSQAMRKCLQDSNTYVRIRAAYGLGIIFPQDILDIVPEALDQENILVRNNFIQGIANNPDTISMDFIFKAFKVTQTQAGKRSLALLVPHAKQNRKSVRILQKLLKQVSEDIRKTIFYAILGSENKFWINQIKKLMPLEK